MSQNVISLSLTTEQWAATDAALTVLEQNLAGLVSLSPTERARLPKMGDKSEAFCRHAADVMGENPGVLPVNFDIAEMRRDLAMHDALRPRLIRLERLFEKANDTDIALGSDVMSAALEGYAFLKIAGKGEGLESLRRTLSARFNRTASAAAPDPIPTPTPVPAPTPRPAPASA